ncbi:MAG TPA: sulfur reductase subunit SreC [Aquificaceae bacterium]|nr:sulfur reductase subunit SreC [Aquificaceae bacterium]
MHPPLSLIFFFLTAGTSIGLFVLMYSVEFLRLFGKGEGLPGEVVLKLGIIELVLMGAGAFGASFHLGHKLRAWKAIKRFRTSWLSREAVFSGAYGLTLLIYLLLNQRGSSPVFEHVFGSLTVIMGVLSAFSTAMIYASNKFVLEWNSSVVVIYYLLMYLMLGSTLMAYFSYTYELPYLGIFVFLTFLFLVLGFAFRLAFNVRQFYLRRPTLNEALNLPHNRSIRVVDIGTTTDNFCTTEFYYRKGKELLSTVLPLAYLLTFIVPLFLVIYAWVSGTYNPWTLGIPYLSVLVGSALERWSFFVEGNHVQNLFYGLYPKEGYRLRKGYMEKKETRISLYG